MAIGLLLEHHDEDDAGVLLPGHMFPLPVVGKKRKGGPSREAEAEALRVQSPWMNPLDIGPLNHIQCEAIEILDDPFPEDLAESLTDTSCWSSSRPDSPAVLDFDLFASFPPQPASSGPAAKKQKCADVELSRSSSSASGAQTPDDPAMISPERTLQISPDTRRGENVRKNPQMQQTARDGQKHWHDKVQEMRMHYDLAHTGLAHPQFQEQRLMCNVRNLKCQKESLLMFLQFAAQQGLISPLAFVHPGDESAGFLGWTGFYIVPGCGARFRAGVEGLFPDTPKVNTLYHLFRRSGLVPEDWRRAWDGEVPFTWNPARSV